MKVTLYDTMFSPNNSAGSICHSNNKITYVNEIENIAIYTDSSTNLIRYNKHKHKLNVAWLIESPFFPTTII
jgi:hypothetical protein